MTATSGPPANRPTAPACSTSPKGRQTDKVEERLESLLADPIVQLLMERDGVEREVLLRVAQTVRRRAFRGDDRGSPSAD